MSLHRWKTVLIAAALVAPALAEPAQAMTCDLKIRASHARVRPVVVATGPASTVHLPAGPVRNGGDASTGPRGGEFTGLAENAWDFNDPNGVPGFGPIDPKDTEFLLAQVPGQRPRAAG